MTYIEEGYMVTPRGYRVSYPIHPLSREFYENDILKEILMMVQTSDVNIILVINTIKVVNFVIVHFIHVGKVLPVGNGLKTKVYGVVKTVNGYTMIKQ